MIPDKCPHCDRAVLFENGSRAEYLCGSVISTSASIQTVACTGYERDTLRARVIDTERQLSDALARVAVLEEAERSNNVSIGMFRARVRELEAVVNDPKALWANWLRGTVRLPSGIGDVRALNARVRELEERNKRLVEAVTLAVRAYATAETKAETGPRMHDVLEDAIRRDREAKP